MDREKVIEGLEICTADIPIENGIHKDDMCQKCPYHNEKYAYCFEKDKLMQDALALLKGQDAVQPKTIPEELKQKMWNALYAEEDKYEEKYVGTKEHNSWFLIYRPWLQEGFNLAIKAIADWEGR